MNEYLDLLGFNDKFSIGYCVAIILANLGLFAIAFKIYRLWAKINAFSVLRWWFILDRLMVGWVTW